MEDNTEPRQVEEAPGPSSNVKVFMVIATTVIAFYFAYSYANTYSQPQGAAYGSGYAGGTPTGYGTGAAGGGNTGGAGGGGCCGGGGGGPQVTKEATLQGDKQVVDMVVSNGWNPNVIKAKANIPLKINLDIQQAGGCVSSLVIQQLNIGVQLQSGTKTALEVPPLQPGTYQYSCQMGMINGQLIVQ
ncbi:MAG: cupredoxin domain-containing protein [Actinobacteria bacterium]|nr:cupredoxin domain-containing protein [Actinomycetota bacterium]